jgi:N-acyl-phosphatidylethanolamine-hydrolysing phospholipase D
MRAPLPEELSRADDFALFAPVDRSQRAAEIGTAPMAHFDDRQHAAVQTHQIEFAAPAAQIARKHFEAVRSQMLRRESFRRATLKTGIHVACIRVRAPDGAGLHEKPPASWQNDAMPSKSHHTAQGFRNNYVDSVTKSLAEILRWQFQRLRDRLPPAPTLPTPQVAADLEFIRRNARAGGEMTPAVTWIGHATMLVQATGLSVLTDPIFSTRASPVQFVGPARAQQPGIALRDLPHIDVVAISHNHYDHLDRGSVRALAAQAGGAPLFLVPLGLKRWLARLGITQAVELDWWETYVHPGGAGGRPVEFLLTPAQHWSSRSLSDRNRTLWGGWAVMGADCHWYFTGDTGYSKDFKDVRERLAPRHSAALGGGFDVALIAVGACLPRWFMREQHVDLMEAVQIHLDLGAKRSVGVHWGTFALADDPIDLPLHDLAAVRRDQGVEEDAFFLLPVGGTRQLPRRALISVP